MPILTATLGTQSLSVVRARTNRPIHHALVALHTGTSACITGGNYIHKPVSSWIRKHVHKKLNNKKDLDTPLTEQQNENKAYLQAYTVKIDNVILFNNTPVYDINSMIHGRRDIW